MMKKNSYKANRFNNYLDDFLNLTSKQKKLAKK